MTIDPHCHAIYTIAHVPAFTDNRPLRMVSEIIKIRFLFEGFFIVVSEDGVLFMRSGDIPGSMLYVSRLEVFIAFCQAQSNRESSMQDYGRDFDELCKAVRNLPESL